MNPHRIPGEISPILARLMRVSCAPCRPPIRLEMDVHGIPVIQSLSREIQWNKICWSLLDRVVSRVPMPSFQVSCVLSKSQVLFYSRNHAPHSHHSTIKLAATQARVSSGIPWITQMVCELSADPPTDFHCNTTTAIDEQEEASILTISNANVVSGSLRPVSVSTNSMQHEYSLLIGALLGMALVAGVAVRVGRRTRNANLRVFTTIDAPTGDKEPHGDATMHSTTYNSI